MEIVAQTVFEAGSKVLEDIESYPVKLTKKLNGSQTLVVTKLDDDIIFLILSQEDINRYICEIKESVICDKFKSFDRFSLFFPSEKKPSYYDKMMSYFVSGYDNAISKTKPVYKVELIQRNEKQFLHFQTIYSGGEIKERYVEVKHNKSDLSIAIFSEISC